MTGTAPAAARLAPSLLAGFLAITAVACAGFLQSRPPSRTSAVAASHPLATESAARILTEGGSAIDAAIAAALVLNVAEPWNSGLGGGGFALVHDPEKGAVSFDFRERAPAGFDAAAFEKILAKQIHASVDGPLAVAVPSLWPALIELHARYGRLPLDRLVEDARRHAADGVALTGAYGERCERRKAALAADSNARRIFLDSSGNCPASGWILVQPELASVLGRLAPNPSLDEWNGIVEAPLAKRLAPAGNPVSGADLRAAVPVERPPVRGRFRNHEIVSMGPPSSGGIIVIGLLQTYEAAAGLFAEMPRDLLWIKASRLAFFDRAKLLGDPGFSDVPSQKLTSADYARRQAARIKPGSRLLLDEASPSPAGGTDTTHLSVVDKSGLAVAMTLSINTSFGSGVVIPGTGILLNNHMDDFYLRRPNAYGLVGNERNAPAPGKRPLSSMAPTLLYGPDGKLTAALGSPGGSRIPSAVAWTIRGLVEKNLSGREAICSPRLHHQWQPDILFADREAPAAELAAAGYTVQPAATGIGNVQMVLRTPSGWEAHSDCRGEGTGWSGTAGAP
ncbi:MAG: gamma-glutamyltransferase [Deltaproteobacteria bacterium]|nr:gamma-glutamyltransferase [Deltaproteobacteria bacterium]